MNNSTLNIELNPPESLTPPPTVNVIEPDQAAGMIKIPDIKRQELDEKVQHFINSILSQPVQSESFKASVEGVHQMANQEIREAASISNRLLAKPANAMNSGFFDEGSKISTSLVELRKKVESLDPSRQGNLFEKRKLLGIIPLASRIDDYFQKYQSSESHLKAILEALYNGKDELLKDNAAIEEEKVNAWQTMEKLEQYIYLGKKIDAAIESRLHEIQNDDPEKARVIKEELLFYVRQKVQDLLTQLAVTIQGYLAMDMIRKNNLELIKGVERATTTTISALRTAVIVAQALANQKLVLDQIGALNTTTSTLISGTSNLLKSQAAKSHQQATGSTIEMDQLRQAFKNIYETMDMVSGYKIKALDNMQQTVSLLSHEVEKSKTYLDRVREEQIRNFELDVTKEDGGYFGI